MADHRLMLISINSLSPNVHFITDRSHKWPWHEKNLVISTKSFEKKKNDVRMLAGGHRYTMGSVDAEAAIL